MRGLSLVIIIALSATAILFVIYSDDVENAQDDFQAYSRRALLPEDEGTGSDIGE